MEELKLSSPQVYSVSELNSHIKKTLESSFKDIWVEGEVSNFYFHNNQHMYFDLKDEYSKIKVVMFYQQNRNLLFEMADGLHLLIRGYVSLYEKRGEYQIIAVDAKPVGKGSLILAFEQLKEKLQAKGYFDPERKKPIPVLPKKIGLATSTGGAVIRDIISVLSRRSRKYHLVVRNVNVQGRDSAEDVCRAIDDLSSYGADVIIIARGGGSLEDLWGFNTEILADKIVACPVPIISAIGHETDFTISDFVADVRAATPSVAAEMVTLDKAKAIADINNLKVKLYGAAAAKLKYYYRELDFLLDRKIFKQPLSLLAGRQQLLDDYNLKLADSGRKMVAARHQKLLKLAGRLSYRDMANKVGNQILALDNYRSRLSSSMSKIWENKKNRVQLVVKSLHHHSPAYILGKGFGIIYEQDRIVHSINQVQVGQTIKVIMQDGYLWSKVLEKIRDKVRLKYE